MSDKSKTPDPEIAPAETPEESRVTEMMGPPQETFAAAAQKKTEPTPPPSLPEQPEAPVAADEIEELNKKLAEQMGESQDDLDMTKPPETFAAVPEQDTPEATVKEALGAEETATEEPGKDTVSLATKPPVVMRSSLGERFKQAWYAWWDNKPARYGTLALLLALVAALCFVKPVRTWALNTAGVRTKVSVTALDGSTHMPLKNVRLSVDGREAKTDENGYAKLTDVRLGDKEVAVSKAGFASYKKKLYLGTRITDLGEVTLKVTGTQYTLHLVDYFSGKSVSDVEISSGEATAKSDKDGKALLTMQPDDDSAKAEVSARGYRTEKVTLPDDETKPVEVTLVPAAKEVYVSKESGTYDLYKMDFDGQHKEVLLKGSGRETPELQVLADAASDKVAFVATRDDRRNADGYLLKALMIVDVASGDVETIEHSEDIKLVGWDGSALVYTMMAAGASAANSSRQRLMSYDVDGSKRLQLATANYFAGTILQGKTAYYVVSSTDPGVESSFSRVNTDATGKKTVLAGVVWAMYRSDYSHMLIQTNQKWYQYKLGDSATTLANPPNAYGSRQYLDTTDGKLSAWVDTRDSSGVLTVYNVATDKNDEITKQRGLREVVRWVNDKVIVYRVMNQGVVTEHAVSVEGGEPRELTEVSLTY